MEADRRWARFFQAASKIVVSLDFPREPRPHPSPSTQRRSPIGGCFQALTKRSPSSATRGCDKKCRFSVSSSSRARLLRLLDRRPLAKSRVPDKTLRGIESRHSWPSFYLVRSFVRSRVFGAVVANRGREHSSRRTNYGSLIWNNRASLSLYVHNIYLGVCFNEEYHSLRECEWMAELVAARLSSIRSDSLTRFWIINKNNNELDRCGENWRMERARDRSRWQRKGGSGIVVSGSVFRSLLRFFCSIASASIMVYPGEASINPVSLG